MMTPSTCLLRVMVRVPYGLHMGSDTSRYWEQITRRVMLVSIIVATLGTLIARGHLLPASEQVVLHIRLANSALEELVGAREFWQ